MPHSSINSSRKASSPSAALCSITTNCRQARFLIVNAKDENEVKEKLKADPWFEKGILKLESIRRWEIFVDELTG